MKNGLWLVLAWVVLIACWSTSSEPKAGSQTHFLGDCGTGCTAPYSCICGICTLLCETRAHCALASETASCEPPAPASGAQCAASELACDVTCTADRDCQSLGSGYACSAQRCRRTAVGVLDAGAGARGDSGSRSLNAGDSGSAKPAAQRPAVDAGTSSVLCDGSDSIRLGMWNGGGGGVDGQVIFMHPFGFDFAFVDGQCRFYASWNAMKGIVTGVLSAAEAAQMANEVGWANIARFSQHMDQACPDAGSSMISDGARSFGCSCGCDATAPAGLAQAEAASHTWIERLAGEGTALDGPVRALATDLPGGTPPPGLQTWPLSRSLAALVVSEATITATSGVVIDLASDANALRLLRQNTIMQQADAAQIFVQSGASKYLLSVRDELPTAVDSAFHDFQRTGP